MELQRGIIAALNARYAAEEAVGNACPPGADPGGFRLLHGCELEVRADGRLDYEDDLLARFDLVVASVHVARRQSRAELTRRTLNAIRSPHVDVIAHPAGRMIQDRDDLDLDWDAVFEAAAATGTALEMNGSPHRLDLAPERARRAVAAGCLLSIDSDAHRIEELAYVRWGVDQARRAWVEPRHVLNARGRDELLAWVAAKPSQGLTASPGRGCRRPRPTRRDRPRASHARPRHPAGRTIGRDARTRSHVGIRPPRARARRRPARGDGAPGRAAGRVRRREPAAVRHPRRRRRDPGRRRLPRAGRSWRC